MLQFIVLGQIPGTSVQINFYPFITGIASVAIVLLAYAYLHERRKQSVQQASNTKAS